MQVSDCPSAAAPPFGTVRVEGKRVLHGLERVLFRSLAPGREFLRLRLPALLYAPFPAGIPEPSEEAGSLAWLHDQGREGSASLRFALGMPFGFQDARGISPAGAWRPAASAAFPAAFAGSRGVPGRSSNPWFGFFPSGGNRRSVSAGGKRAENEIRGPLGLCVSRLLAASAAAVGRSHSVPRPNAARRFTLRPPGSHGSHAGRGGRHGHALEAARRDESHRAFNNQIKQVFVVCCRHLP